MWICKNQGLLSNMSPEEENNGRHPPYRKNVVHRNKKEDDKIEILQKEVLVDLGKDIFEEKKLPATSKRDIFKGLTESSFGAANLKYSFLKEFFNMDPKFPSVNFRKKAEESFF